MKAIDASLLKQMYISGANNLYNHYPEIDQLNVFPVPDGDTGMNMNLTVTSGAKEIANRNDENVFDLASAFSKGLLMGARGNSGVITSQIFRGFAKSLEGKKEIGVRDLGQAFISAKDVAYKAVMKPVEGTILTVIRESAVALNEHIKKDTSIEEAMDFLLKEAEASLQRTPDLLPVLKEVGVVDSGGAGLVKLLEGMDKAVHGEVVPRASDVGSSSSPAQAEVPMYAGAKLTEDEEGYGYCTQFIVRLAKPGEGKKPFIEKKFKSFLANHGKSLVMVRDDDIVKVHVHTLTPGNMLNFAQNYGEFVTITIENMSEEHHNIENGLTATDMNANLAHGQAEAAKAKEADKPLEKYAIVAVSAGKGLDEIFSELGVQQIVSGGQTMNPSTQDFLDAIKRAHARNVFILPNNSNIVMAASQACDVLEGSEVTARVVPSKTIPQGMVSALQFNPDLEPDEVYSDMKAALKSVDSGSVTYAIKDTDIEGVHITKDYYMAMKDKKIVSCVKDKLTALYDLIDSMVKKDSAILTVLVGNDVSNDEQQKIDDELHAKYGDAFDIDIKRGDQPVYSFLVGVE
jgi:DAK2 domain fusion protein YloV